MADEPMIGKDLGTLTCPGARSKVHERARSLGEHDPIFTDVEVAPAAGVEDIAVRAPSPSPRPGPAQGPRASPTVEATSVVPRTSTHSPRTSHIPARRAHK